MLSKHLILCCSFFFSLQSCPAAGSFPMSQLFASGGQNIGASALALVLPMNIEGWFPLGLTGLISLPSKGLSRVFSSITVQKHPILQCSVFFMVQLSYLYMTNGKTVALTLWTIVNKVTSLLLNTLSRLVIAFLPRRVFLILWLQSPSTVILEPKKIKSITASTFSLSICHEVMGMRTPWTCLFENNKIIIFKRGLMLESV